MEIERFSGGAREGVDLILWRHAPRGGPSLPGLSPRLTRAYDLSKGPLEARSPIGLMPVIMALLIPTPYGGASTTEAEIGRLLGGSILVKWELTDAGVICSVIGNIEEATLEEFGRSIAQLPIGPRVVFELSGVPYVDTTGLAAIVGAVTRVRAGGGEPVVCAPRPSVKRLFQSANFGLIADVRDTLDEILG